MSQALGGRIAGALAVPVAEPVRVFARRLAEAVGACAVLFYGSNLRTGELEGVLDFYLLRAGPRETGIWPRVSYHEWESGGQTLRAKAATMTLAMFRAAAAGETLDTTIWTRFTQPAALVWASDDGAAGEVAAAVVKATATAARLAAALGPASGAEPDYWRALFRETYAAEFRVEKAGREESILTLNAAHFAGLLPLALEAAGIACEREEEMITPMIAPAERRRLLRWWRRRRRLGKPYNLVRLVRASATFDGAARYAAWKIERHSGVALALTPWQERHPLLAAPGALWRVWRIRQGQRRP